jgi:hypothetical protein
MPKALLLVPLALLAACGVRKDLKPTAGHSLPTTPVGADHQPTAADLLAPRPQERPGRAVELRTRSEPRTDDPFDLPPQE